MSYRISANTEKNLHNLFLAAKISNRYFGVKAGKNKRDKAMELKYRIIKIKN